MGYNHKPNMNVLRTVLCDDFDTVLLEKYIKRAKKMNESVISSEGEGLNLEKNYQIGHAYFLKIKNFCKTKKITPIELEKLWEYSLLPLLEEYLGNRLKSLEDNLDKIKQDFCKSLTSG